MSVGRTNDQEKEAAAARLAAMFGGTSQQPAKPPTVVRPPAATVRAQTQPATRANAVPTMWEVRGAFKDSGKEATLTISALTQAAAEHEATEHGLLVESCWPARPSAPPPLPAAAQPMDYATPGRTGPATLAGRRPVAIERHSKEFKWQALAAFGVCMFGLFGTCLFAPVAMKLPRPLGGMLTTLLIMCFFGGLAWGLVNRFRAWWHHG